MSAPSSMLLGNLFALAAFFCMAFMGFFTKLASQNGSALWVSFLTYVTGAVLISMMTYFEGLASLKTKRITAHFMRATFGLCASFTYMLAMQTIPITNATLLFNTAPIFIPIIATFWLGVKVPKKNWLAVLVGFIGILIIIKPTRSIFSDHGSLYGLASGMTLAVAYLLIKLLTSTEPPKRILFYYFVLGTLFQIPLLFGFDVDITWQNSCFAICAGVSLYLAQTFLIKAYQLTSASQVGVYQYTSVVFVGILDWIVWGFVPPPTDLIGVILVIVAGAILIRANNNSSISQSVKEEI